MPSTELKNGDSNNHVQSSPSAASSSSRWLTIALGVITVAAVGTLWYSAYTANRSELEQLQLDAKRRQTLRALAEVPGRRFNVGGSYESQRKDALATLC